MSQAEWLELESDPGLFTLLLEDFGVKGVQVEEIYDLSKPITEIVYGFIFLFHWNKTKKKPCRRTGRSSTGSVPNTTSPNCSLTNSGCDNNRTSIGLVNKSTNNIRQRSISGQGGGASDNSTLSDTKSVDANHNNYHQNNINNNDTEYRLSHLNPTTELSNEIFFAHQVVQNSCATHALLSILLNRPEIDIGQMLIEFQKATRNLCPQAKGLAIGSMPQLAQAHNRHANKSLLLIDRNMENNNNNNISINNTHNLLEPSQAAAKAVSIALANMGINSTNNNINNMNMNNNNNNVSLDINTNLTITNSSNAIIPDTFHFVCYLPIGGYLYELDGLTSEPINHGPLIKPNDQYAWTEQCADVLKDRMQEQDVRYNLLAVVPDRRIALSKRMQTLKRNKQLIQDILKRLYQYEHLQRPHHTLNNNHIHFSDNNMSGLQIAKNSIQNKVDHNHAPVESCHFESTNMNGIQSPSPLGDSGDAKENHDCNIEHTNNINSDTNNNKYEKVEEPENIRPIQTRSITRASLSANENMKIEDQFHSMELDLNKLNESKSNSPQSSMVLDNAITSNANNSDNNNNKDKCLLNSNLISANRKRSPHVNHTESNEWNCQYKKRHISESNENSNQNGYKFSSDCSNYLSNPNRMNKLFASIISANSPLLTTLTETVQAAAQGVAAALDGQIISPLYNLQKSTIDQSHSEPDENSASLTSTNNESNISIKLEDTMECQDPISLSQNSISNDSFVKNKFQSSSLSDLNSPSNIISTSADSAIIGNCTKIDSDNNDDNNNSNLPTYSALNKGNNLFSECTLSSCTNNTTAMTNVTTSNINVSSNDNCTNNIYLSKQSILSSELTKPLTVETHLWFDTIRPNNETEQNSHSNTATTTTTIDTVTNHIISSTLINNNNNSVDNNSPKSASLNDLNLNESRPQTRALTRASLKHSSHKSAENSLSINVSSEEEFSEIETKINNHYESIKKLHSLDEPILETNNEFDNLTGTIMSVHMSKYPTRSSTRMDTIASHNLANLRANLINLQNTTTSTSIHNINNSNGSSKIIKSNSGEYVLNTPTSTYSCPSPHGPDSSRSRIITSSISANTTTNTTTISNMNTCFPIFTIEELNTLLKKIDEQAKMCDTALLEEEEKRLSYRIDDSRRVHNYEPFIRAYLLALSKDEKLKNQVLATIQLKSSNNNNTTVNMNSVENSSIHFSEENELNKLNLESKIDANNITTTITCTTTTTTTTTTTIVASHDSDEIKDEEQVSMSKSNTKCASYSNPNQRIVKKHIFRPNSSVKRNNRVNNSVSSINNVRLSHHHHHHHSHYHFNNPINSHRLRARTKHNTVRELRSNSLCKNRSNLLDSQSVLTSESNDSTSNESVTSINSNDSTTNSNITTTANSTCSSSSSNSITTTTTTTTTTIVASLTPSVDNSDNVGRISTIKTRSRHNNHSLKSSISLQSSSSIISNKNSYVLRDNNSNNSSDNKNHNNSHTDRDQNDSLLQDPSVNNSSGSFTDSCRKSGQSSDDNILMNDHNLLSPTMSSNHLTSYSSCGSSPRSSSSSHSKSANLRSKSTKSDDRNNTTAAATTFASSSTNNSMNTRSLRPRISRDKQISNHHDNDLIDDSAIQPQQDTNTYGISLRKRTIKSIKQNSTLDNDTKLITDRTTTINDDSNTTTTNDKDFADGDCDDDDDDDDDGDGDGTNDFEDNGNINSHLISRFRKRRLS